MSEDKLKECSVSLVHAANDYLIEKKSSSQPQLITAHIGDELTITILVCATLTECGVSDRLGAAVSAVAQTVMNEQIVKDETPSDD